MAATGADRLPDTELLDGGEGLSWVYFHVSMHDRTACVTSAQDRSACVNNLGDVTARRCPCHLATFGSHRAPNSRSIGFGWARIYSATSLPPCFGPGFEHACSGPIQDLFVVSSGTLYDRTVVGAGFPGIRGEIFGGMPSVLFTATMCLSSRDHTKPGTVLHRVACLVLRALSGTARRSSTRAG
jgi:hypothetical protein